jgi:hypothetical protein
MRTARCFACVLALVPLLAGAAAAGERQPTRSGSSHREVTRTGPDGQSRTWKRDSTWQRGAGQYDRQTTQTGPNGAVRSLDVHAERTPTGHTRQTTYTDPQGRTRTREVSVTRSSGAPAGTVSQPE